MKLAGIDGCRAGWCVAVQEKERVQLVLYPSIADFVKAHPDLTHYLIDMPIGLGEENCLREIDLLAKKHLPSRQRASIFMTPCREAVYAKDYQTAKAINKIILGKSISIQAWNICSKIKELDQFLIQHSEYRSRFYECHPEIAFYKLAGQVEQLPSKKTNLGIDKRKYILEKAFPNAGQWINDALKRYLRKEVKIDDLIDALVLLQTASSNTNQPLSQIVGQHQTDAKGIPMRMVFRDK